MKLIDCMGKKYGRLAVVGAAIRDNGKIKWKCVCDCGKELYVDSYNLRHGLSASCGCYASERRMQSHKTHGDSRSRLYVIYRQMIRRCYTENCSRYKNYGARGIKVCKEWRDNYSNFKDWAIRSGYDPEKSIDRINNDGDYEPENCRWADDMTQANNKSTNRFIESDGKRMTLAEWERETGISQCLIRARIDRLGWSEHDAVTTPSGEARKNRKKKGSCNISGEDGNWLSAGAVARMLGVSTPTVVQWYKKEHIKTVADAKARKLKMQSNELNRN